MSETLLESAVVFLDVETGGGDVEKHPLIQWAGVAVDSTNWRELGRLNVKISGWRVEDCDPQALSVVMYDPRDWRGAIPLKEALLKIKRFLSLHACHKRTSASGWDYYTTRVAGHKCEFDWRFTQHQFAKADMFFPAEPLVLDTLQLAVWRFWRKPLSECPANYRLSTLAEWYGIPTPREHDAEADTDVCIQVCRALCEARPRAHSSLLPF